MPATRVPQFQQKVSPAWSFTPQYAQYALPLGDVPGGGTAGGAFASGLLSVGDSNAGAVGFAARGSTSNTVPHSPHCLVSSVTIAPQIGQT